MDDFEKYLDIDYSRLPQSFVSDIKRYIESGHLPGKFLQALIYNDLSNAVYLADRYGYGLVRLGLLTRFFQNEAPAACWGSSEAMELWKARRGIRG